MMFVNMLRGAAFYSVYLLLYFFIDGSESVEVCAAMSFLVVSKKREFKNYVIVNLGTVLCVSASSIVLKFIISGA